MKEPSLQAYSLEPIRTLAASGFNPSALLEMERLAYLQVAHKFTGIKTLEDITAAAEAALPQGERLFGFYTQTLVSLTSTSITALEEVADDLQAKAEAIEGRRTALMQLPHSTIRASELNHLDQTKEELTEACANLICTAKDLDSKNIISVARSEKLKAIAEPTYGPIGEIFSRAVTLLGQSSIERQRAA